MENELLSIIVPVYNIEEYIPQCIESILNQTYRNLEIILVNDGSTDRSKIICEQYSLSDSRIIVVNKNNGGLSDARNAGIEVARGKYIGFVDGDDWIENTMYSQLYSTLIQYNADFAFGIMKRCTKVTDEKYISDKAMVIEGENIMTAYICGELVPHIQKSVCDKLYSRELIGETKFLFGKHGEDGPFNMEVLPKAKKCVYVPGAVYHYRDFREGSISTNNIISERLFTDRIPIMKDQIRVLNEIGRLDLAKRQEKYFISNLLDYFILCEKSGKENIKSKGITIKKEILNNSEILVSIIFNKHNDIKIKLKIILFLISSKLFFLIFNKAIVK